MRLIVVALLVLGFAACGGKKTTKPKPPGDPAVAGDPVGGDATTGDSVTRGDSVTPGDTVVAAAGPNQTRITSGSGAASSTHYKARVRIGGPLPPGAATAAGKTIHGSTATSP